MTGRATALGAERAQGVKLAPGPIPERDPSVTTEAIPAELTRDDLAALPIFPLPSSALFPGSLLPLHVFEPRYRELVRDALTGRKLLAVARLKPGFEASYDERPDVFERCGCGVIVDHARTDDGRYNILLRGLARVKIVEEHFAERNYRLVRAETLADTPTDPGLAAAFYTQLGALWPSLAPHLPAPLRDFAGLSQATGGAGALADHVAALLIDDTELTHRLMSELDPCERLRLVVGHVHEIVEHVAGGSPSTLN